MCTAEGSYILDMALKGERKVSQSASRTNKLVQEKPDAIAGYAWQKFLKPLCYTGYSKLIQSLGDWNTTTQNSQWLWPFYYLRSANVVYWGYRKNWYSNEKYQFASYKGKYDKVFEYDPVDGNIEPAYIPNSAVWVDFTHTPRGWRGCQHQPVIPLQHKRTNHWFH